jgi:hypothetical protein
MDSFDDKKQARPDLIITDLDKANYSSGMDKASTDFNATGNDFANLQPKIEPSEDIKVKVNNQKNVKKQSPKKLAPKESTFAIKKSIGNLPHTEMEHGGETIMHQDDSSPRDDEATKIMEDRRRSDY